MYNICGNIKPKGTEKEFPKLSIQSIQNLVRAVMKITLNAVSFFRFTQNLYLPFNTSMEENS